MDYDSDQTAGVEILLYEIDKDDVSLIHKANRTYENQRGELNLTEVLNQFEKALDDFGFSMDNKKLVLQDVANEGG